MSLRLKVYGLLAVLAVMRRRCLRIQKQTGVVRIGRAGKGEPDSKDKKPRKRSYTRRTGPRKAKRDRGLSVLHRQFAWRSVKSPSLPLAEGIVQKVLAEEGDFVKEGQVLCPSTIPR